MFTSVIEVGAVVASKSMGHMRTSIDARAEAEARSVKSYDESEGEETELGSSSSGPCARRGVVHTLPHKPHLKVLTS
jgi:hypothetical protein